MMETLKKAETAHAAQVTAWQGVLATAVKGSAEAAAAADAILHHLRVLADIRRDLWKESL